MQRIVNGRSGDKDNGLGSNLNYTGSRAQQESGLYCALAGGKEKLQERSDTLGPSCFVMLGAGNHFESQIAALVPAFFNQDVTEAPNVFGAAAAFFGAHVEPDSRTAG